MRLLLEPQGEKATQFALGVRSIAGVRVSGSFGSFDTLHKGRLFMIRSTSARSVTITSRDGTVKSEEMASRIRLQGRMSDSNIPPL